MGGVNPQSLSSAQQQLSGSAIDRLVLMSLVMTAIGTPLLILLHELGHAFMARRRGLPVSVVRVGGKPLFEFELAGLAVEVGPWFRVREPVLAPDHPGSFAYRSATRSDPADTLAIALAGPAATIGAGALAWYCQRFTAGDLHLLLGLFAFAGIWFGVWNLVPRTPRRGPTDGRLALSALTGQPVHLPVRTAPSLPLIAPSLAPDPRASTSIPPPVG